MVKTINGGASWSSKSLGAIGSATFLGGVSCATTSACVLVGGMNPSGTASALVYTTANGGGKWVAQTPPAGNTGLQSVSCVTSSTCEAVGDGIAKTTNGGATWTQQL